MDEVHKMSVGSVVAPIVLPADRLRLLRGPGIVIVVGFEDPRPAVGYLLTSAGEHDRLNGWLERRDDLRELVESAIALAYGDDWRDRFGAMREPDAE